jgi:hypothetical protein
MAYGTTFFIGKQPRVADIFTSSLTITQLASFMLGSEILVPGFLLLFILYYPIRSYLRSHQDQVEKLFRASLALNRRSPRLFWTTYLRLAYWGLFDATLTTFEADYAQAWREHLEDEGGALDLQIFVGRDALSVPVLFNVGNGGNVTTGSDDITLAHLRMWYEWMQYKRGFGERIIPRQLIRIDKVEVR